MRKLLNFIGGERIAPASGNFLESFNPSLGEPHLLVSDSDARDVAVAVEVAKRAFPAWAATGFEERAAILERIADRVDAHRTELAQAESSDQGKPVWLATQMDITRVALNFRFFAGELRHRREQAMRLDESSFSYVLRQPVGVAGLISPWNLPLYLLTWKIAPAIAAGNTVVCKPSELTSLTASLLCDLLSEAGVPAGVVNVVFGTGAKAGGALVEHPDVPLISFTGGTATGRAIALASAPRFKRLSLELGGKNPNIVFDDADLEQAVSTSVRSSFLNQGEICLCGSRIYVHEAIFADFVERLAAKTRMLKIGDPKDPATFMGPLVSSEHRAKIEGFLNLAREEKVVFVTSGGRPDLPAPFSNGYFLEPTILTGVAHSSRLQQEEIFGPVVSVTPFTDEEEAIALANGVTYGLSATVWTRSLERAHAMGERLEAGTVWVNTWLQRDLRAPFGGMKASGLGREGQEHSLDFFTETKTICIKHRNHLSGNHKLGSQT